MPKCLFCHNDRLSEALDLGASPLSNAYVSQKDHMKMEPFYPLKLWFCPDCGLVQLEKYATPEEIFSDYDYFSSYSDSWLAHAKEYVLHMMMDYGITPESSVVEIASNDGYLLQYFHKKNVNILGVEPAANVADVAIKKGIPTEVAFFGVALAKRLREKGHGADLILGNNVIAHVPNINDFVEGLCILLNRDGFITMEFPHLFNLIKYTQFDTIYHEHFFYYSLSAINKIFAAHNLKIFNVEKLPTHGGSLRIFACHAESSRPVSEEIAKIIAAEREAGLLDGSCFEDFSEKVMKIKLDVLQFLLEAKRHGEMVCAYGAAAKGNTLLNYCGIKNDFIKAVADKNPAKQHKYLPGSRIPIVTPEELREMEPDYLLVLPWNLLDEITCQEKHEHKKNVKFVKAIPNLEVIS